MRTPQKRCCNLSCQLGQFTTKILVSLNKYCIFEHLQRGSNNKESFCHENSFLVTFSELPLQAYVSITQRCAVPLKTYIFLFFSEKMFFLMNEGLNNLIL